ncbi:hypothetical protein IFR04_012317 [Cadophora malorum]|uniref:Uncharacterized protein n=1 Tax=Cadophora malorum TaxID=108018 RepID=A0A8H7W8A6_9HELO|nr:hypothetical protein IFR04_012317 [Cadophora malorum]
MSQFIPDESLFSTLKGKVVVITGGAQGIGAALVKKLNELGSLVVFGDLSHEHSQTLLKSLGSPKDVTSVIGDLASYEGNYKLFKAAFDKYGKVDHAIANAALFEYTDKPWIDAKLTIESVADESLVVEHNKLFDLNVYGLCVFARMAAVFLKENRNGNEDKSLTLFGSVCNLRDSPGAYVYQTTKAAVLGLLRSMRGPVYRDIGIRTNNVCPGVTETPMTWRVFERIKARGLSYQQPEDVVKMTLGVLTETSWNGKSIYCEAGTAWEFEEALDRSMKNWLGETPTQMLRKNAEFVNTGALLRTED